MNIVQLQDMLRGIPDDRLQTEMQQPSGSVPQYLVLSEIVRRDKARSSAAEAPKTTVVEDMMNQAQMAGGLESLVGQAPMAPEEGMQEAPAMYADGGFISPADAMGRAGVAGYPQPQQKPPFQLSTQPNSTAGSMFTPNTNPAPAPQTNFNLTQQQPANNGMQNDPNMPSFMEQPNAYAQGGVVALAAGGMPQDLAFFIKREADRLGIDPVDLATTISYETAGTFDPAKKGPTTKWGKHIGLIQMGGPQREQYGYDPNGDLSSQMRAVGDYLADRGVKPGMGLLDVYSTVNAGAPGLYNRSDEKAGGAPGTVLDKVRDQMSGHREKAMNLLQMFSQNAGDMMLGAPVGLAGRETTAGLGQGAGAAAIGNTAAPILAGTQRGGGIRSLFTDPQKSGGLGAGLRDLGSTMAQGQQAPEAPAAQMKSADISGLDRLRTSPEEELAQYAALRQQYITGGYADGGTIRMSDGSPGEVDPRTTWEWITGVTKEDAAKKREGEADATATEEARILYEADPERKARILGERGPLMGDARIPEEAKAIAANSAPSPYQLMAGSQERQQKMLQDYYDSLIQLERDRMNESQGFGAFLKELGRGMLSNTSAFGPSVAAGAARAIGSREDTSASARERMGELELAKKKAQIEGIAGLDKLRYDQAVGDKLGSRETAQYILPTLTAKLKAATDAGDIETANAVQQTINDLLAKLGVPVSAAPTAATSPEAESEEGFWSILGKI